MTLCEHCGFVKNKPWHVPDLYMASGERVIEDCLLCGAETPRGHVVVKNTVMGRVGRVCASHTLFDVTRDERERFTLTITYEETT